MCAEGGARDHRCQHQRLHVVLALHVFRDHLPRFLRHRRGSTAMDVLRADLRLHGLLRGMPCYSARLALFHLASAPHLLWKLDGRNVLAHVDRSPRTCMHALHAGEFGLGACRVELDVPRGLRSTGVEHRFRRFRLLGLREQLRAGVRANSHYVPDMDDNRRDCCEPGCVEERRVERAEGVGGVRAPWRELRAVEFVGFGVRCRGDSRREPQDRGRGRALLCAGDVARA
mmetsp:Transcript_106104/g.306965  ORF Transcript_106104/g.306965 Transcript_106104/m.306965 type:complete len:229 (-) Transcript_106104:867-1553(-)